MKRLHHIVCSSQFLVKNITFTTTIEFGCVSARTFKRHIPATVDTTPSQITRDMPRDAWAGLFYRCIGALYTDLLIVKIFIFRIILVNIVVIVFFFAIRILGCCSMIALIAIIRITASNDGLADTSNPIILFLFRVGIEQIRRIRRTNFK
jgi:hypothetical protein